MSLKVLHMTKNVPHFCRLWAWRYCDFPIVILTGIFVECASKLTLPFKIGYKALSVTCGDSSPKGRAKATCNRIHGYKKWSVSVLIRSIYCFTDTRPEGGSLKLYILPFTFSDSSPSQLSPSAFIRTVPPSSEYCTNASSMLPSSTNSVMTTGSPVSASSQTTRRRSTVPLL